MIISENVSFEVQKNALEMCYSYASKITFQYVNTSFRLNKYTYILQSKSNYYEDVYSE